MQKQRNRTSSSSTTTDRNQTKHEHTFRSPFFHSISPMAARLHFISLLALVSLFSTPSSSLTFNITDFSQSTSKFKFGDGSDFFNNASIQNNNLVITNLVNWTTGRATYTDSLRLYDAASGSLSDFSTHFSFVIDSNGVEPYSDGLAFFLAPVDFPLPENQEGSGLGLVNILYKATSLPFVAVEFDTFENAEFKDLPSDHVGIDVSSMESVAGVKWKSGVLDGKLCEAWIAYDAVSKELSVVFTGFDSNATVLQSLNYTIDLRNILPENVCLGFSAGTGAYSELHSVHSWWFDSKLVVLNETSKVSPAPSPKDSMQKTPVHVRMSRTGLVIGLVIGVVVAIGLLAGSLVLRMKRGARGRGVGRTVAIDVEFERSTGPKRYSYKELTRATDRFDEKNKLGEGGFGGVYKGMIKGTIVAIKRVSKGSSQGVKEYASEVTIISQLRHRNLVQLSGWCHERDELLLVYEFMPNGSLDTHLFKSEVALTWSARFKIAQGLASALLYLHEGCDRYVVHRDIKSSNIMLDSSFNAKLGDFGLAKLVEHLKESETTVIAGTQGYIDPESVMTGKTTKQSDVYSFGVVALELACGRKSINLQAPENEVSLVDWVYDLNQDSKLLDAVDPKLNNAYNETELQCLLVVGLWCAQPTQVSRPSIRQASLVLNFEAPLPTLPDRVPNSLSYFNRPVAGNDDEESFTRLSLGTTSSSL